MVIGICGIGKSASFSSGSNPDLCTPKQIISEEEFNIDSASSYDLLKTRLKGRVLVLDEASKAIILKSKGIQLIDNLDRSGIPFILVDFYSQIQILSSLAGDGKLPDMPLVELRPFNEPETNDVAKILAVKKDIPEELFQRIAGVLHELTGGFSALLDYTLLIAKAYGINSPLFTGEELKQIMFERTVQGKLEYFSYVPQLEYSSASILRNRFINRVFSESSFEECSPEEQAAIIKMLKFGWLRFNNGKIEVNGKILTWMFGIPCHFNPWTAINL